MIIRPILTYGCHVWWEKVHLDNVQRKLNHLQGLACLAITGNEIYASGYHGVCPGFPPSAHPYHGPTPQNKHGAHYAGLIGSDEK